MTGRKLSFTVSLLPLAMTPVGGMAADVNAQSSTRYLRHNDPFHSLNDPEYTPAFPGNKDDFFR